MINITYSQHGLILCYSVLVRARTAGFYYFLVSTSDKTQLFQVLLNNEYFTSIKSLQIRIYNSCYYFKINNNEKLLVSNVKLLAIKSKFIS